MAEAASSDPVTDVAAANSLYKTGNFREAIYAYTRVLNRVGTNYPHQDLALIYYNRGSAFLQLKHREDARKDLEKVLKLNSQHDKARAKLRTLGELDCRVSSTEFDRYPNFAANEIARADAMYGKGEFEEAINLYTDILTLIGNEYPKKELINVYMDRGSCAYNLGRWKDAIRDSQRVLRYDRTHEEAGHMLMKAGPKVEESILDGTDREPNKPYIVDHNLTDTFSLLPHVPSLAHYRLYLQETDPEEALNNINTIVDEGLKSYSEKDYLEAEDKFMLAVAICEKFSEEGFKNENVCRTAATWLLKCGILEKDVYVTTLYIEYLVSLPTVTTATIPFIDAVFVETINSSLMTTNDRIYCLEMLHQYGLCLKSDMKDIQTYREPILVLSQLDPELLSQMCHMAFEEGNEYLDAMDVEEALNSFRSAYDFLFNSALPRNDTLSVTSCTTLENPIKFSIFKCLILLADFRRIHVNLTRGSESPCDENVMKLLRKSKAPSHRKASVLVVLHGFGHCKQLSEKDLYDPVPDVNEANNLYRNGRFQEAVNVYNNVLERIGDSYPKRNLSLIYYNRGSALLQLARREFERTVQLNPDHEKAKMKLSRIPDFSGEN